MTLALQADRRQVRVALVDDHPIVRDGTCRLLVQELALDAVREFSTGEALLRWFRPRSLDLLVLDLSLPDRDGLSVLGQLHRIDPGLPILVFSMFESALYARQVYALGARAFVSKREDPQLLVDTAAALLGFGGVLADRADAAEGTREEGGQAEPGRRSEHPLARISAREREVFLLLARGLSVQRIADLLHVSDKTVFAHRSNVFRKLGFDGQVPLALWARDQGLT